MFHNIITNTSVAWYLSTIPTPENSSGSTCRTQVLYSIPQYPAMQTLVSRGNPSKPQLDVGFLGMNNDWTVVPEARASLPPLSFNPPPPGGFANLPLDTKLHNSLPSLHIQNFRTRHYGPDYTRNRSNSATTMPTAATQQGATTRSLIQSGEDAQISFLSALGREYSSLGDPSHENCSRIFCGGVMTLISPSTGSISNYLGTRLDRNDRLEATCHIEDYSG